MPDSEHRTELREGQVWHRIGGKQIVRIARVWTICGCDSPTMHHHMPEHGAEPVTALRANPTHGGSWWTVEPEFLARYELIEEGS